MYKTCYKCTEKKSEDSFTVKKTVCNDCARPRKGNRCYKCKRYYIEGAEFTFKSSVCDDCCKFKGKVGNRCTVCGDCELDGSTFSIRNKVCDNCVKNTGKRTCPKCFEKKPREDFEGRSHCGCKLLNKPCSKCGKSKPKATFQNKFTCADCELMKTCKSCGEEKPFKTFRTERRCIDCPTPEELDEPGKMYCPHCSTLKDEEQFMFIASVGRRRRQCLDCKREADRQYAKENAEMRAENSRKWLENYMTLPLSEITHGTQQSYTLKKCRCDVCIKWYAEIGKPRQIAYMKANPEAQRARFYRRRHKATVTMNQEDIDLSVVYRKVIKNDICFFCGVNPGEEDEHWLAIDNGGTDHWWNLTRSCWTCNRGPGGKHTKLASEYYLEKLERGEPINPRFEARVMEEAQNDSNTDYYEEELSSIDEGVI